MVLNLEYITITYKKYMIASSQIKITEIFAFIAVESYIFVYKQKRQDKLLKSRLLF